MTSASTGPVVIAYDGSALAKAAITEAARQLGPGREALVLTVWQPFSLGFVPSREDDIDAARLDAVRNAAERTAAEGASLAETAGFKATSTTTEDAAIWKAIVKFAEDHDADLTVLGSHGRTGLVDILSGSVAVAVEEHSRRPVLIVHRRD